MSRSTDQNDAPLHVIDMFSPRAIAQHAVKTTLIATIIPSVAFYIALTTSGLRTAVIVAISWYYAVLLTRVLRKRPIIGAAMVGAGLLTLRTATVFWTGSAYLYFLQPVAGTVAVAVAIAVTAFAGRPLIERLVHDFVPVPAPLSERLRASRFYNHASALWALVYAVNAIGTVWLLTTSSLGLFVLLKTVLSPVLIAATVTLTYLMFRRFMRRENVALNFAPRPLAV